ncbi:Mu transposase C-terminal domain-containing protein [Streptomyces sp. NPDC085665]|uniref:Mu transposase C-terminal domain-containing protein n=1 Tax=Streptomyces sp. NPDC085665 TaxID=3365735 RepID=UPI0037CFC3F8
MTTAGSGRSPRTVSWRRRAYIADWMAGHVGTKVRLRYLPHFDGRIEVFSTEGWGPAPGQRLSPCPGSVRAGPER